MWCGSVVVYGRVWCMVGYGVMYAMHGGVWVVVYGGVTLTATPCTYPRGRAVLAGKPTNQSAPQLIPSKQPCMHTQHTTTYTPCIQRYIHTAIHTYIQAIHTGIHYIHTG